MSSSGEKKAAFVNGAPSAALLEIVRVLEEDIDEIAAGVVARCARETPSFSLLTKESAFAFEHAVKKQLTVIARHLGGDVRAVDEAFAIAKNIGALFAREGLPLDALGEAITIADQVLMSIVDRVWKGSVEETLQLSRLGRAFALAVQRGASEAYLESKDRLLSDQVKELQRRARSMRLIHEVGRELVSATDLDSIYRLAVATVVSMLEVPTAALILCGENDREPKVAHSIGLPAGYDGEGMPFICSEGGGAAARRLFYLRDVPAATDEYPGLAALGKAGLKSLLGASIVHEDAVIGGILACSAEARGFTESETEAFQALASELGMAITKARLFESERRRRRESVTLLEVSEAVSSALRVEEVLERVATYAVQAAELKQCRIFLYDLAKERLVPRAAAGLTEAERKKFLSAHLRLSETRMSLRIIGERRFLLLEGPEIKALPAAEVKAIHGKGSPAVLGIPLLLGQRVLGVMYLEGPTPPAADVMGLLVAMGRQAAIALENARLFGLTEQKAEQSGALFRASQVIGGEYELPGVCWAIAKEGARLVSAAVGLLYLWREGEEALEVVSVHDAGTGILGAKTLPGEGMAGRVAQTKEPLVVNRYQEWENRGEVLSSASAAVAVPILHQDQLTGVLVLAHRAEDRFFDEEDVRLLSIFTLQTATAIQKALLYEDWKRRAWELDKKASELRTVGEVTRTILSTPHSLEATVAALTARVRELTACDRVSLALTDPEKSSFQILGANAAGEGPGGPAHRLPFDGPLAEVVLRNETLWVDDILADGEHRAIAHQIFDEKVRSCIAMPLVVKGHSIGVLTMGSHKTNAFSQDDLGLAEELAALAAIALQNAELSEFQQRLLETLQNALLPETIPPVPGLEIGVYYGSATMRAQLGGDLYDFIFLPEGRVGFVIGDVCGKGIQAASDMAMSKFVLRGFALTHPSPASVLHHLNNALHLEMKPGRFVTLFYGVYDPAKETFTYSSGGHPRPLHYRNDVGEAVFLKGRGTALGIFPRLQYQERVVRLRPGDVLLMYTDGVIEARKDLNFFGDDRLQELVERENGLPPQALAEAIYRECLVFTEGKLSDDLAIVVIKRAG